MQKINLGSIADVVAGVSYSLKDIANSGIRILRGGNIQNNAIILKQDDVFLLDSYCDESNSVREGDTLVVASTGSTDALGKAATSWADIPDTQIGAFLRIVRPKDRKWAATVSAWLTQPIFSRYIVNRAKGTGINNIKREYVLNYPIYVHDEKGLVKFSRLYEGVDRLIELSRKRIENLEKLAKEIYDYWFVQFDFPDKCAKPYRSSGGKMVYNAELKREIPAGWDARSLPEVLSLTMGQSPDGKSYNDKGVGTLFYQGATDFEHTFPSPRQYTTSPCRMAKRGAVLMSVRAPVGTTNRVLDECCIGRGLCALSSKNGGTSFAWHIVEYLRPYFDRKNNDGTTFGAIGKDEFSKLKILSPTEDVVKQFGKLVKPIDLAMVKAQRNIDLLVKTREFLLPLLMNGQVKLKG